MLDYHAKLKGMTHEQLQTEIERIDADRRAAINNIRERERILTIKNEYQNARVSLESSDQVL